MLRCVLLRRSGHASGARGKADAAVLLPTDAITPPVPPTQRRTNPPDPVEGKPPWATKAADRSTRASRRQQEPRTEETTDGAALQAASAEHERMLKTCPGVLAPRKTVSRTIGDTTVQRGGPDDRATGVLYGSWCVVQLLLCVTPARALNRRHAICGPPKQSCKLKIASPIPLLCSCTNAVESRPLRELVTPSGISSPSLNPSRTFSGTTTQTNHTCIIARYRYTKPTTPTTPFLDIWPVLPPTVIR